MAHLSFNAMNAPIPKSWKAQTLWKLFKIPKNEALLQYLMVNGITIAGVVANDSHQRDSSLS